MSKQEIAEYYAVPDPRNDAVMTYWKYTQKQGIKAWPRGAQVFPAAAPGITPQNCPGHRPITFPEFSEWLDQIEHELNSHLELAMARFAAFTFRCCRCGRRLTDPASKTYGIGPDCRHGLPIDVLAKYAAAVARVHGQHVHEQQLALDEEVG